MAKTKVVAVLNQKGGTGKTTLATNIASLLHINGESVMIADIDPQGSATDWAEVQLDNNDDYSFPVISMGKNVSRDLVKVSRGYDWVIIDGGARASELSAAAIKAADVVLLPMQPSPYDVWASRALIELVQARQEVTDGKPKVAIIMTMVVAGTNIGKDVKEAVKSFDIPMFESQTHRSVNYPETAMVGGSVLDRNCNAADDIKRVVEELREFSE